MSFNLLPQTNTPRGTCSRRPGSDIVDLDPDGYILKFECGIR